MPNHQFALSAWVDESVIVGPPGGTGTYTIAAVVADTASCGDLRRELLGLAIKPGVRLHWRGESVKRRDVIAAAIGQMDIAAILTVGAPMERSRQERARRCCLEQLLHELAQLEVSEVRLESRTAAQDRRDLQLVDSARRKRLIPGDLLVGFAKPGGEPMLWLPDAVAGAMSSDLLGDDRWLRLMAGVVSIRRVAVR
ncbi:hypothetical protein HPO96_14650 [Kribbella sandramycini]|uniref:Uncharacterized protein n=1 Tax=Kribbella sandramycini TaxID=60450 RepID=A0A7Y4KZE7_9ACTN|nr:hypothetical protein [Kribbella sandramycini]MBB6565215.1 hypothetical protein [Kribbella sandramycini]NOL41484.1 hypothetical protein [Kribbella sandramycini]